MQFIKRSACPPLLATNKERWTAPWIAYYSIGVHQVLPTKPTDGHWRKDEIRIPLIKDFHNNCGFCGDSIPIPLSEDAEAQNIERVGIGDVEHLKPKSKYPELVYEWTNYLWSCKPCNFLKKEFYDERYPFLNPCCEEDCANLVFIEDTGRYELRDVVADDDYWKKRLRNTELKTLLNSDKLCNARREKIMLLRGQFESIERFIPLLLNNETKFFSIVQKQIDDRRAKILTIMESPNFYYLLQEQYQMLLLNYPKIAEVLKTCDLD